MSSGADDRFREMFYEEARELLIGLEEGLMDLERRQSDRAHLDRTFRAAHSLKGAAAMVGLATIAEFTHGIEAVLDRIRAGALPVDSDIITTLLEARDHLAAMVESEAARSPIPPSGELTQRLGSLLRGPAAADGEKPVAEPGPRRICPPLPLPGNGQLSLRTASEQDAVPADAESQGNPVEKSQETSRHDRRPAGPDGQQPKPRASRARRARWPARICRRRGVPASLEGDGATRQTGVSLYRITLTPGPDVLRRGINPLGVLDELRDLGETSVTTDPARVPPLDQLDPERCYLSWTITLKTDAAVERLGEAFLFFAEDSTAAAECQLPTGEWKSVRLGEAASCAPRAGSTSRGSPQNQRPAGRRGRCHVQASRTRRSASRGQSRPPRDPRPRAPPCISPRAPAVPVLPRLHARIRVDATQLDDLVGLAGELVVVSDNLMGLRELNGADTWTHALEALQRVSRQIRDTTLDLRMVPVDELFSRFPRVVRDLADRSGKEIELRIVGQETRLDRTIVERLSDPMIHLIRNAVDHALEHPSERVEKGKPRHGPHHAVGRSRRGPRGDSSRR